LELLHQVSRWQGDDDLVFGHPDTGRPFERSRLLKRFKATLLKARVGRFEPMLNKAGEQRRRPVVDPRTNRWVRDENGVPITEPIERPLFRFHDLRHTFGTQLASEGIAIRKIQEWMGHADFATTLIYSHFMPGAEDAEKIAAAFGEAKLEEPPETGRPGLPVSGGLTAELKALSQMRRDGDLTAEEFTAAKAALLAAA
jgi:integrase